MSRAVIYRSFGGPEVHEVQDVPEPHAGPGQVRIKVAAAGLNPMDWGIAQRPDLAAQFGVSLPAGFGFDFAGAVDEAGEGVTDYTVGDRVYGGAMAKAVADYIVLPVEHQGSDSISHTPEGISDEVAATLPVAGHTTMACLAKLGLKGGDTVLVGGAAGGVGIFVVQMARLAGARVIGTASEATFGFLRDLGVEPVTYGPGLEERVREMAPDGVTAAIDLFGLETLEAAVALGVAAERITTIAAGPTPPHGVRASWGGETGPDELVAITDAIQAGQVTVPIAATFPIEEIHEAVKLQTSRHAHGKVVIVMSR